MHGVFQQGFHFLENFWLIFHIVPLLSSKELQLRQDDLPFFLVLLTILELVVDVAYMEGGETAPFYHGQSQQQPKTQATNQNADCTRLLWIARRFNARRDWSLMWSSPLHVAQIND